MFGRKPKNDMEKLDDAIKKMNALRNEFAKDNEWGFVGAVMISYHALKEGCRRQNELPLWDDYEKKVLQIAVVDYPNDPKPPSHTPYQ